MKVEAVLQGKGRDVFTIAPTVTVAEAVDTIHKRRIGAVVIIGTDDATLGIFSERAWSVASPRSGHACLKSRSAR